MNDTTVIQPTDDGVPTLYLPGLDEHYHSTKGALTEARHVYIDMALRARGKREISLLEVGFGTGLNAWLTLLEAQNQGLCIRYTAFELYPLDPEVADRLDAAALSIAVAHLATRAVENLWLLFAAKIAVTAAAYALLMWLSGSAMFRECLSFLRNRGKKPL